MSFIGLAKLLGCQLLSYLWFIQVALSEPTTIICSTDNPKGSLHVLALEKFGELVSR